MNKKFGIFLTTTTIGLFFSCSVQLYGISSVQGMLVTIKNQTTEEFIAKLVNLESSQEVLVEVLAPQNKGRDTIKMVVPPGLYAINTFHAPTNKTTTLSSKNLRALLSPTSACITVTLKPRIYPGEPQVELLSPPSCE